MLAADRIRFGGANQDLLWNAFAKRGLGEGAVSVGHTDPDPTPGFTSPYAREGSLRLLPVGERGPVAGAQLFVGRYQARAVPVADTDPATPLTDRVDLVPGTYEFVVRAPGYGHTRIGPVTIKAGQNRTLPVQLRPNLASATTGATVAGDGINLPQIVDDDEATTGPRSARRSPAGRSPSTWPAASSRYAGCRSARCCARPSPVTRTPAPRAGTPRCGSSGSWRAPRRGR